MPNKIYQIGETAITFDGTVGANIAWSLEGVANNAGQQSAFYDRGVLSAAKAGRYHYRLVLQFQATPTVGYIVRLYMKTSDGTHPDNDDGTGDIPVSSEDKLKNLKLIDIMKVDEAVANIDTVVSGIVDIWDRYVGFVIWNESGAITNATDSNNGLVLTPLPFEIQ